MQVALRIRPLNEAEAEEGAALVAHRVGEQVSWGGGIVPGPQESPHDGDPGVCRAPRRPPRDSGSSGSRANACFQSCTAPGLAVTQQGCSFPCKWHFFSPVLHLSPLAPLFKRQGLQEVPTYLFYIAISSYAFLLCPCSLPSFAM